MDRKITVKEILDMVEDMFEVEAKVADMLYKDGKIEWDDYERTFGALYGFIEIAEHLVFQYDYSFEIPKMMKPAEVQALVRNMHEKGEIIETGSGNKDKAKECITA